MALALILVHSLTGNRRIEPSPNTQSLLAERGRKPRLLQTFGNRMAGCEAIEQGSVLVLVQHSFASLRVAWILKVTLCPSGITELHVARHGILSAASQGDLQRPSELFGMRVARTCD